jgi:hypothetical protein
MGTAICSLGDDSGPRCREGKAMLLGRPSSFLGELRRGALIFSIVLLSGGAALAQQSACQPIVFGPVDFGSVPLGSASADLGCGVLGPGTGCFGIVDAANSGVNILITTSLGGANPGDFRFSSDPCNGQVLTPGTQCIPVLRFQPMAAGLRTATLDLSVNGCQVFQWVLHGVGTVAGAGVPTNAQMFVAAINGVPTSGMPDQVTIAAGDCVTLALWVKFRTGAFFDVSQDASTRFFTDPPRGTLTGDTFCATNADRNHTFPIYGRTFNPAAQQAIQDNVIVKVHP